MQRVFLVTGAGGFVGANICHRLVALGEEVHIFVRNETDLWRLNEVIDQVIYHEIDLTDGIAVSHAINKIKPTIIYHLATHGAYQKQQGNIERIFNVNNVGTLNLLGPCIENGFELFVNTGSSSEYGKKEYSMRESDLLEPDSYYAISKSAQSMLCQYTSRVRNLPIVTMRLFSVYGPYEEDGRLIPAMISAMTDGNKLNLVGADVARDYIFIEDVINAYLEIDKLKILRGEILNLGTGVQTNLAQLVEIANVVCNGSLNVEWGTYNARTWDTNQWVGDVSRIRSKINFIPKVDLYDGIKKTYIWHKDNNHNE